jgi:hypothetical protein
MDFNDIQSAWDNDNNENVVLPNNLEKIQTANTPLDKIKKILKELVINRLTVVVVRVCTYHICFLKNGSCLFIIV